MQVNWRVIVIRASGEFITEQTQATARIYTTLQVYNLHKKTTKDMHVTHIRMLVMFLYVMS